MSYSSLVNYIKLSPNCTQPRHDKIDRITIHHMAGNLTVEQCGDIFSSPSRQASSNYGIGSDGRIACYVDENNRAWTTGGVDANGKEIYCCGMTGSMNDHKAVTIEVANCVNSEPWTVSDKAMASLIRLCIDICIRNNISSLNYTGDPTGNLTMHKWFAYTGCPGTYLESKFPFIADQVNKKLKQYINDNDVDPHISEDEEMTGEQIYRALCEYLSSLPQSNWSVKEGYFDKAKELGVMDGMNPRGFITREQLAAVLGRNGLLKDEK